MGSEKYTWLGGRTVLAATVALGVLSLSSRFHWGLPGVWAGLVSLVACNGLADAWRLLQQDSPLAVNVDQELHGESMGSVESLEKAWQKGAVGEGNKPKVVAGTDSRD